MKCRPVSAHLKSEFEMIEVRNVIGMYVKGTCIDRFTHCIDVIGREASVLWYLYDQYLACCGLEWSWRG